MLERYLPRELVHRRKMGFSVPVGDWLRGPLRPWAEALLDRKRLEEDGFLDSEVVHRLWREHQDGRRRWHTRLWTLLMFQAWLDTWRSALPPGSSP